ncbi:DUF885 domain-containing protein [Nocardia goodfellowii]
MTSFADLSDRYVSELAAADPCLAAIMGVAGQDSALTDYSPEGFAAREDLTRRTLRELDALTAASEAERRGMAVLRDRLRVFADLAETGVPEADLSNIDGIFQRLRTAVEVLDQGESTSWDDLRARLAGFADALAGARTTLLRSRQRGRVAARRQVQATIDQCAPAAAYFRGFAANPGLAQAAESAAAACAEFGEFLTRDLISAAPTRDAVGRERYELEVRRHLGAELDLRETYAWGWSELARLETEMRETAAAIRPGATPAEVAALLHADPRYRIESGEPFRAWIQELADQALADLHGTHFDIPEPVRYVECRIPPTPGAAYYYAPSEDLKRPGQVWYATYGEHTATWDVPAVMYHESVPGHHLQLAMTVLNPRLDRFQRMSAELHAGTCEGWALYAERLMDELGYYTDPAYRLGMLMGGQQLRTARVILDIGMHLELEIPRGTGFHEGERWNHDLGFEFLRLHSGAETDAALHFEIDRYLGMPGQAIAYKVGERVWTEGRAGARTRHGTAFDLKSWHMAALDLGPMGLDLLRAELATL